MDYEKKRMGERQPSTTQQQQEQHLPCPLSKPQESYQFSQHQSLCLNPSQAHSLVSERKNQKRIKLDETKWGKMRHQEN
jgi:hypothetical protein